MSPAMRRGSRRRHRPLAAHLSRVLLGGAPPADSVSSRWPLMPKMPKGLLPLLQFIQDLAPGGGFVGCGLLVVLWTEAIY
jgi:hypothetical protein